LAANFQIKEIVAFEQETRKFTQPKQIEISTAFANLV
jgi:hypothetical protein